MIDPTVIDRTLPGGATARFTGRGEGDLSGSGTEVETRRRSVVNLPWIALRQVHGSTVVHVGPPGDGGHEGDASVSRLRGAALAVLSADCAPVALSSPEGVIGVAHAGWRGLRAGVVAATVSAMGELGATRIEAVIGPCVHRCCYEFGAEDLEAMVTRFGPAVRSNDRQGRPALDLPAAVGSALTEAGVTRVGDVGRCTSCSHDHWSWRAARDKPRQATVVWR